MFAVRGNGVDPLRLCSEVAAFVRWCRTGDLGGNARLSRREVIFVRRVFRKIGEGLGFWVIGWHSCRSGRHFSQRRFQQRRFPLPGFRPE